MKVIFLDVDGVLNKCSFSSTGWFDPELMANLAWLVRKSGAFVVLSSTWRMFFNEPSKSNERMRQQFNTSMKDWGIAIHSHTPDFSRAVVANLRSAVFRGEEIQAWLDDHPETSSFVILDDNTDMLHLLPHLVKTDSFTGLTRERAQMALKALQEPL